MLAEPELVRIKGANATRARAAAAGIGDHLATSPANDPPLVGRTWELNAIDRDPR